MSCLFIIYIFCHGVSSLYTFLLRILNGRGWGLFSLSPRCLFIIYNYTLYIIQLYILIQVLNGRLVLRFGIRLSFLHSVFSLYTIIHYTFLSLHYIHFKHFKRQVGEAGVGESEPCKALVDNGRETSPEIVSQNTFQKLSPHCWMGKKKH